MTPTQPRAGAGGQYRGPRQPPARPLQGEHQSTHTWALLQVHRYTGAQVHRVWVHRVQVQRVQEHRAQVHRAHVQCEAAFEQQVKKTYSRYVIVE